MFSDARITLLVTGSIAAYKAAELVRELTRRGARVRVVMSQAATEFITPLTLQTLSGSPVTLSLFDVQQEAEIGHIALADEADLVIVAPASANVLAKAAQGIADDAVTAVLLATRAPVLVAPAMNVNMWQHPATQANVHTLRQRGVHIVEPEEGQLACGWIGAGRLPEVSVLLDSAEQLLAPQELQGFRVIVTAGPTREYIDPIRFITNRSSGKMGYALAAEARMRGAEVVLISGPTSLRAPFGSTHIAVETAAEMRDAVFSQLHDPKHKAKSTIVLMAAAVADHRPAEIHQRKLKRDKTQSYNLEFAPCPDILLELGQSKKEIQQKIGSQVTLVGFAAETAADTDELIVLAREKLQRKKVDLLVANFARAMSEDSNRVWLLTPHGSVEEIATSDKRSVARRILAATRKAI